MKHVQACLCARKDVESSLHHCGCPVKLEQACLCAENTLNAVLNTEEVLLNTFSPGSVPVKMEKAVFTTVEVL